MKFIHNFLSNLRPFFRRLKTRPSIESTDSGIFDPYVPIGSVKRLDDDYQAEFEPGDEVGVIFNDEQPQPTFTILRLAAILVAMIVAFRLMNLQITRGQENFELAKGNSTKKVFEEAPRGLIYDRNGKALVQNTPSFSVVLRSVDYPKKRAERDQYLDQLTSVVGGERESWKQLIEGQLDRKVVPEVITLMEGISREQSLSLELKSQNISGVELTKQPIRSYQPVPGLGNLLGYIGKIDAEEQKERPDLLSTSYVGKSGVENSYDRELQGQVGQEILEVDSRGRAIRSVGSKSPVPGNSLVLGLDADLQTATAQALQASINRSGAKNGAAVAIDVATGEILTMVSLPTFDNNIFSPLVNSETRQSVLQDPGSPLINRAIAGQYPSGSTIKPFVATAALDNKVVGPDTKIDTSAGEITIGQWTFRDWKTHGVTDVRQAIAESNNIFFYTVGGGFKQIGGLGAERLASYLGRFGFGDETGIDIPGEKSGLVPTPDWKKKQKKEGWYIGDTYNLAIGQGDLLITPLQLSRATAAVANGGKLLQPRLVRSSFSQIFGQKDYPTIVRNDSVAPEEYLLVVREGMRRAVTTGSARSFANLPIEVAAKTGTAQFDKAKEKTHSWFTAFAPFQNPRIAVAVIVEGGGEGFAVAAPVAKNIIEQYFKLPLTPIQPLDETAE